MKVKKKDYKRVLLTEVLPYEVPIWFSNKGIYSFYKKDKLENAASIVRNLFNIDNNKIFTPYRYKIRKNTNGVRVLSIIHPLKQYDFVRFYEKYDQLILSFCNKSPISIRYPSRVASDFYDSSLKKKTHEILDEEIEIESDGFADQEPFSSSYFSYAQFSFLYKFFDSYHFNSLEKKFSNILRFDIGNCFNSVYTHSISWSTKSKEIVKETMEYHSFELAFDKKMQSTKARETNGIVIGPEVSRIFAEIILQKIDTEVILELEIQYKMKHNIHYSIRRYIDDYFVFTSNQEDLAKIQAVVIDSLDKFNFSLNPAKTKVLPIPYVSEISTAKTELNSIFESVNILVDKIIDTPDIEPFSIRPSEASTRFIHKIKSVVVKCNISIDKISAFVLARLRGVIFKFYKKLNDIELNEVSRERIGNFSFMFFDIFFYFLCVDARPRSTYILSQIVSKTTKVKVFVDDVILTELIHKKIADELNIVIGKISGQGNYDSLELINLLYIQKQLGSEYTYSCEKYINLTGLVEGMKLKNISYFTIISSLLYFGANSEYSNTKKELCEYVVSLFKANPKFIEWSDGFCLVLDFISCPHVEGVFKDNVVALVFSYFGINASVATRTEGINYISKRQWFTSWNDSISLEDLLEKFELKPCY
jgi:hypothetical protein